jgi:hypothetical protein
MKNQYDFFVKPPTLNYNKENNKDNNNNKFINLHILCEDFQGDFDIKLKINDTIKTLKEEIKKMYNYFPKNQEFFYGSIHLSDEKKKIIDYGVRDGSILVITMSDN